MASVGWFVSELFPHVKNWYIFGQRRRKRECIYLFEKRYDEASQSTITVDVESVMKPTLVSCQDHQLLPSQLFLHAIQGEQQQCCHSSARRMRSASDIQCTQD